MRRSHIALLLGVVVLAGLAATLGAQTAPPSGSAKWADSARAEIELAFQANDLALVREARVLLERALTAFPEDPLLLHYQGYAWYRECSLLMTLARFEDAAAAATASREALERSIAKRPMAESYALLSGVLGRLISANRERAMELGPLSQEAMSRASALDATNPRVWLLRGEAAIFTPAEWGGGLRQAEQLLARAVELYASDRPAPPLPAWGRGEAYAWLGQVYQRQAKNAEALAMYRKALEVEPGLRWVRETLLPSLGQRAGASPGAGAE